MKWADPLGLELHYGNTAAVGGWHQKVYVEMDGKELNGISFGLADRNMEQQGSSNASSGGGPAGGKPGSGVVYRDKDSIIKVQNTFETTREEDLWLAQEMSKLIGQTGPYSVPGYTCRTFSQDMYKKFIDMIEERREQMKRSEK